MKSRKWTSEEKFAVVMQGLKGEKSVSEICRENGLSQTMYYKWCDAFVEGGNKSYDHALEAEIEKLQKIIGKQAIEIEVLKKTDELFQKR